jgi:hypothetical protein
MVIKTAVALILAATVSACAYDTYSNRDRFDPRRQREYRTADNGRWGSRYDDEYRHGFLSGYEQGYRDARGRGRGQGRRRP